MMRGLDKDFMNAVYVHCSKYTIPSITVSILSIEQSTFIVLSRTNSWPFHTKNGPVVSKGHVDLWILGGGNFVKIPYFLYFSFSTVIRLGQDIIISLDV